MSFPIETRQDAEERAGPMFRACEAFSYDSVARDNHSLLELTRLEF